MFGVTDTVLDVCIGLSVFPHDLLAMNDCMSC